MMRSTTLKVAASRRTPDEAPLQAPSAERQNQPGRPTAAELERRKARVMEVATKLFVHHGYAATSLVDIARLAGVATRTLYQHFGDKEALFRDVVFARDTGAIVPAPKLEPSDTLHSALIRTAQYCIDVAFRPTSINLMRLMVAESTRFPDLMKKVATSTFARFRRNVAKMFEELAEQGFIPDVDHARSAVLFTDLILGNTPIMTYTNWETSRPSADDLEARVELFILGRFGPGVAKKARTSSRPAR